MAGLVLALAGGQLLSSLFNLARAKSVAVYLGPVGMGLVSLVDQLAYVVAFTASFALPQAGLKYLSRAHSRGPERFAAAYALFVQTLLCVSVSLSLVASLVTLAWPQVWGPSLAPWAGVVVPALLTVPTMGLHGLQFHVFAALERPELAGLGRLLSTALMAIGAIAGMLLAGLVGLYVGNLLGAIMAAVLMFGYTRWRFALGLPGGVWPDWGAWRQHRDVLRFCASVYLISVAEPLAILVARYAIVQSTDLAELGLFQSAFGLAAYLGLLFVQSTSFYLTPLMNRDGPADVKTARAVDFQRQLVIGATLVALPLALFPRLALSLLFSEAFVGAAPYLVFFVLGQLLLLMTGVFQALLIGLDDLRTHLIANISAQAALAILCWFLAPGYGLWGLVTAFLVTHAGLLLACLARLALRHGTRLPARSVAATACGLILVVVAGGLGWDPTETAGSVVARLLFAAIGIVVLALFLTRDERTSLRLAWSRVRRLDGTRAGPERLPG